MYNEISKTRFKPDGRIHKYIKGYNTFLAIIIYDLMTC